MSNGDSLDGFVFPPFVPPVAPRPADPPAPQASVPESPAPPQAARPTMPWDVETPIVGDVPVDVPPRAAAPARAEDEDEDLPWLERPEPRDSDDAPAAAAPEAPAATAASDDFPEWMAWDDRDADDARAEVDGVAAVEGLEEFVPEALGAHFSAAPAVDWTEAEPVADAATGSDAGAPVTDDPLDSAGWSLDAPEAAEPPPPSDYEEAPSILAFVEADAVAEPEPIAAESTAGDEEPLEWEPAAELASTASAPAAAGDAPAAADGPFADVAARLEEIARALRERPDELLGGAASDPLALLVAGYVMGYRARGGS